MPSGKGPTEPSPRVVIPEGLIPEGRPPRRSMLRAGEHDDTESLLPIQPAPWWSRPVPVWATLCIANGVVLILFLLRPLFLPGPTATPATLDPSSSVSPCTPALAGSIRFMHDTKHFQGCDGTAWSDLAFCCAPEQPAPPRLSLPHADGCELWLSWQPSAAHGSPVSSYSLEMRMVGATTPTAGNANSSSASGSIGSGSGGGGGGAAAAAAAAADSGTSASATRAAPAVVYRGAALGACVAGLGARLNGAWFSVTAHAVGGSSEPSESVQLNHAPKPIRFEAQDDGTCDLGESDVLRVHFDRPTNRASGGVLVAANGADAVGSDASPQLSATAIRQLLHFSADPGELVGQWAGADVLELRVAPGSVLPDADPLLQQLVVSVRPEGGIVVAPPALSLPADGASPALHVPSCFLEGFEAPKLRNAWVIESVDVSAASGIVVDDGVVHSGRHALRFEGGRAVNFDGLRAQLPAGSRPSHVAFWLRTLHVGNVGYFALGGSSIETSVLFFHLRADGSAGLLSSTGGWRGREYTEQQWLHVEIDIEWPYRRADLYLDGELIAGGVSFASADAQHADEIHLFNFDDGTVWWDDIVVRL